MKAFGVFEGGGVRGYAHIGALRAIERRDIEFEQVAGTSIGAIIASLVAAGYKANEFYREEDGVPIGVAVVDPANLFNVDDWSTIRRVSRHLGRMRALARAMRWTRMSSPLDWPWSFLGAAGVWCAAPFVWAAAPIVYARYWRAFGSIWRQWGMIDTSGLRSWLDQTLRARLDVPPTREILFSDLPIPLRVVVADVQAKALTVIGGDGSTPLVDAVIASASIPFFFVPQRNVDGVFVDGGVLSNIPSWVFDRQRAALPRTLPTIALRLIAPEPAADFAATATVYRFAPRLGRTIIDGARLLELRRVEDQHLIHLESDADVLALEHIPRIRGELVAAGEACVERYFQSQIGPNDPERSGRLLAVVCAHIRQTLSTPAFIRACAILPADDEYLRVACSANMSYDADDQLFLRRSSLGPAAAFRMKEPLVIAPDQIEDTVRHNPLHKYEHAARPARVKTICAVPFFADPADWSRQPAERAEPLGVLCFDADQSIRLNLLDVAVENRIASYAQLVAEQLRRRDAIKFSTDNTPSPAAGAYRELCKGIEVYVRKERDLVYDEDLLSMESDLRRGR